MNIRDKPLTKQQLMKVTKEKFIEYIIDNWLNSDEFFYDLIENKSTVLKVKTDFKKESIIMVISALKECADSLWVMYNKEEEWKYCWLILTAKEYWEAASKVKMDRITFAKAIMVASKKINYWKWVCSWAKSIYYNYSDVYNKAIQESEKNKKQKKGWIRF